MKLTFTKLTGNRFIPADPDTEKYALSLKTGETIHADFKKMRSAKFHRKFFALLNLAFEYWYPGEIDSKFGTPEKNFDRFRRDAVILAGHYHTEIRLDGSVRVEADSISFASMDAETFENLYNNILNVFLKRIPMMAKMGATEINKLTDRILDFA